MIVVGVTGSLASGKSEVARCFRDLGAQVFDADAEARKLVRKGRPAYRAVVQLFGRGILRPSGQIDRGRLGKIVFNSPSRLKQLTTVLHPMVIVEAMRRIKACGPRRGMLVLDVPLLFESKMERLADLIVVVRSRPEVVFDRAAQRGIPRQLARKILKTQWPAAKKAKHADFVVDNNGTRAELQRRARDIYETISVHKGGR